MRAITIAKLYSATFTGSLGSIVSPKCPTVNISPMTLLAFHALEDVVVILLHLFVAVSHSLRPPSVA